MDFLRLGVVSSARRLLRNMVAGEMLVDRKEERTLNLELARELASEFAWEFAREFTREFPRELTVNSLDCAMREFGREGGPLDTGRLTLNRVGVNLKSIAPMPWVSKLLRFVACDGERLLLACEFRPDRRDKLLKSLCGEVDRELGRLRIGMRDMESRRTDSSDGVSMWAAS